MIFCTLIILIFQSSVLNGIDQPDQFVSLLKGKGVGIVVNQTSVNQSGKHLYDILNLHKIDILSIFSPEHGLKGNWVDGETNKSTTPNVYNLYGDNKKPDHAQLKDIDIMIYDIQDVGLRFFTYISTLGYVMEACAENNILLIVLDRINILSGLKVDGPILDTAFKSFVGMYPIPTRSGMTNGELAQMIKGENWMRSMDNLRHIVIPVKNWKRSQDGSVFDIFVNPSPNLIDLEAVYLYSGLCLLEGTNISEGRGTAIPFKQIGAPWFKTDEVISELNRYQLKGITYKKTQFKPITIKGKAYKPKYENEICQGLEFAVTNKDQFESIKFALILIKTIKVMHPEFIEKNTRVKSTKYNFLNKLFGSDFIEKNLNKENFIELVIKKIELDVLDFKLRRSAYLIYNQIP